MKVLKVNGSDRLAIAEFQLFGCDKPLRSSLMDPENAGMMSAQFNTLPHEGYGNLSDGNIDTKFVRRFPRVIVSGYGMTCRRQSK